MITFLLFRGEYFFYYLQLNYVGGWDGDGHFAMSLYYSENIFPDIKGLIPNWNTGLIWPLGYPPLTFFVLSILYKVIPIDPIVTFKVFFLSLILLVPIITFFIAKKRFKFNLFASFVTGVLTIHLLNKPTYQWISGGLNIQSTIETGFYTQLFGIFLFTLWLYYFVEAKTKKDSLIAALLLGLIAFTSIPTLEVVMIFYTVFLLWDLFNGKSHVKNYLLILFGGFLVATPWLLTLLNNRDYYLTKTLEQITFGQAYISIIVFALPATLTLLLIYYRGKIKLFERFLPFYITAWVLFIIAVLPITDIFPNLPLQSHRFVPISEFLFLFPTGYLISTVIRRKNLYISAILLISFIFILPYIYIGATTEQLNQRLNILTGSELQMIEYLQTLEDGRSLIEMRYRSNVFTSNIYPTPPVSPLISSQVGINSNHETLWGIFRENGYGMPFIQPIRDSLSLEDESYGVVCFLCLRVDNPYPELAKEYETLPIEKDIQRAKLLGTRYFVVYSREIKNYLNNSEDFKLNATFGDWQVFATKTPVHLGEVLSASYPTLVFTELKQSTREKEGYDWLRINEEWLTHSDLSQLFVKANHPLDQGNELNYFSKTIIFNYDYAEYQKAYEHLSDYITKGNLLIMLESEDKLFKELTAQFTDKIVVLSSINKLQDNMTEVFSVLNKHSNGETSETPTRSLEIDASGIDIKLDKVSSQPEFIYLRYSYYPHWNSTSEYFLTSPYFTLVYKTEDTENINLHL